MALIIGNGKIDFREFVNMMILNGEQIAWNENDLVEAFRTFDTENKGRSMLDSNVLTLSLDFFYPRWLPIYRAIHLTNSIHSTFLIHLGDPRHRRHLKHHIQDNLIRNPS